MIQSTPGLAEFSADSNTPEEEYHVIQLQPNEPGEEQGDNHVQDPALMMSEKDSENDSDWEENGSDDDTTSECYESASDGEESTVHCRPFWENLQPAARSANADSQSTVFIAKNHPAMEELVDDPLNGSRPR